MSQKSDEQALMPHHEVALAS